MNSERFEESISSGSTTNEQELSCSSGNTNSAKTTTSDDSVPKSSRPQNFYQGRKINNRRPCLWGCGKYLSEDKMKEHVDVLCPRRDEIDEFEKVFNENALVALRHPNGRPIKKTPEEIFAEQCRQEEERAKIRLEIRRPHLDTYFMEHFGVPWSK